MMRPASGPSISKRISSSSLSPSSGATSTSAFICIFSSKLRKNPSARFDCSSSVVSSFASDTSFVLSEHFHFNLFFFRSRVALPWGELLDEELLHEAEHAVGGHVNPKPARKEEHHDHQHGGHKLRQ